MSSLVVLPAIPYQGPIPGGAHEGLRIKVKGSVPHGADSFGVNLSSGLDARSDRLLHLSVRFRGRTVVRNSLQMGQWGPEERGGPFPFKQGGDFTLTITLNPVCYLISVKGNPCWNFNHRLPLSRASTLLIDGQVIVKTIKFFDNRSQTFQPHITCPVTPPSAGYVVPGHVSHPACIVSSLHPPPPTQNPHPYTRPGLNLAPVYNPPIPFSYVIPGGIRPGMKIYVSGRPSAAFPHDWTINLQSSTQTFPPPDIAFHFGVRHHSWTVVRNSRINNVWEWEETGLPHFPFQPGVDFHLLIRIEHDKIMVAVDNNHLLEFRHRLQPLSRFEALHIERDVQISSVRIE